LRQNKFALEQRRLIKFKIKPLQRFIVKNTRFLFSGMPQTLLK
jgi:hypothetical protein